MGGRSHSFRGIETRTRETYSSEDYTQNRKYVNKKKVSRGILFQKELVKPSRKTN